MPDSNQPDHTPATPAAAKKAYTTPTLTECGSVAKLTMGKGSTAVEQGQVVKKGCL